MGMRKGRNEKIHVKGYEHGIVKIENLEWCKL